MPAYADVETQMPVDDDILQASGLWLSYGSVQAVRGVSLTIGVGEIVGLVGLNGAGKTTTLLMLSGVLKPDRGRVLVAGGDPWGDTPVSRAARSKIGFMPDVFPVYGRMTGWDYLDFISLLYGVPLSLGRARAGELAEYLGLETAVLDRPTSGYSTGMRRKLMLVASAIHRPRFLLLDEPTSGLDPEAQLRFKGWVQDQRATGVGVLLSSHSLDLVADCCTTVAIMHQGRLVAMGTLGDLAREYGLPQSKPEAVFFSAIGAPGMSGGGRTVGGFQ